MSSLFSQKKGVSQGFVLSALLFNILMSTSPHCDMSTIVYSDGIAFLASDANIRDLYVKLQSHTSRLVPWLGTLPLKLNKKCYALVFTVNQSITMQLTLDQHIFKQV